MKIAIAGSSGLIGTQLVASLRADGHEVLRLVRRPATAPSEVTWDPTKRSVDMGKLTGSDALINLAGAGVGDHRWTTKYKQVILDSRVNSTAFCAEIATKVHPHVFISASAIGWYGDTADREVDESTPAGSGFLAEVVVAWEAAAQPARDAGIRVVHPRTGLVISNKGGAWGKLLPIFKLGLGGKMGSGNQYWSYISMADEIAALKFLLTNESISGPVNLTAPQPATNAQVTKSMGRVLRRPTLFPVPAFILKTVLGEFSQEILGSTRVVPTVLERNGFQFSHPTLDASLQTLTERA
jgi:uncharacterized protein (TIGR01777 family)